jgi:hypothetical protein
MRRIEPGLILISIIPLIAACGMLQKADPTMGSAFPSATTCPAIVSYTPEQQKAQAAAEASIAENSPIAAELIELARLRAELRTCQPVSK